MKKVLLVSLQSLVFLSLAVSMSPVRATTIGGSAQNNPNIVVNTFGAAWTVLQAVAVPQLATPRHCIATCSADFQNHNVAGQHDYRFTVSNVPAPPVDQGQERTLEFLNTAAALDNSIKEITTTGGWMNNIGNPVGRAPGYFTIPAGAASWPLYCLATKFTNAMSPVTVTDVSMTVTCTHNETPIF